MTWSLVSSAVDGARRTASTRKISRRRVAGVSSEARPRRIGEEIALEGITEKFTVFQPSSAYSPLANFSIVAAGSRRGFEFVRS
jgi:hypothetical protein